MVVLPNALISPRTLLVSRAIQGGIDNLTPLNLLRRDFAGLPRNAQAVLFDWIGDREGEIEPQLLKGLATALHGSESEALAVIDLWRTYRLGKVAPLFDREGWNTDRTTLTKKLREKLAVTVHPVRQISFLLAEAPPLVIKTFHNVVMGTGRDFPRLSKAALERELFPDDEAMHVQLVRTWEIFWEELAVSKSWGIKPTTIGDPHVILSGMLYAQAAGWDLQMFRGWLFRTLKEKPEYAHVLTMFDAVIDTQILCRKREKPRIRPTIPQLLKKAGLSAAHQRKFTDWGKKWEGLAKKLGEPNAVRPRQLGAVRLSERRAAGKSRETLFANAAENGARARKLHHHLLEAGLISDATAVANILIGVNDNPRKPARTLVVPGYHPESLFRAEQRVEELAIRYGFDVKPKSPDIDNRGNSRRLGNHFRDITADEKSIATPLNFLAAILNNPEIGDALGEKRIGAFEKLFRLWNDWQKSNPRPSKLSLQKSISTEYGLPVSSMHTWWRLFDRWNRRFGW